MIDLIDFTINLLDFSSISIYIPWKKRKILTSTFKSETTFSNRPFITIFFGILDL